jgi:DedD protein
MPNDPTAEQLEVRRKGRQRLVGATVLALAAVVFVPMVLDPEPRRDRAEPLLAIPPKEGAPPLAAVATPPVSPEASRAAPESAVTPPPGPAAVAPAAVAPAAVAAGAPAAPVTAAPKEPPKPAAKAPEPRKDATPRLVGFAVQVGAFRDDAKLAHARGKVAGAKLPHYTERLEGNAGGLTRLRAGPFPTREAAEKAAAQLKRADLDARVVPLP